MGRNTLHFAVDGLLFLAVVSLATTGLLMAFVLPPGQGGWQVWGLSRHQWGDLHYWVAVTMLALAILHVALNWPWVCSVAVRLLRPQTQSLPGWRQNVAGTALVAVVAVLIGALLWGASRAKVAGGERHEGGRGGQGYHGGR